MDSRSRLSSSGSKERKLRADSPGPPERNQRLASATERGCWRAPSGSRPRAFQPRAPRAGPRAVFTQVGSRKGRRTASTEYDAGWGWSAYRHAPAYTLKALSTKKKTVRARFSLRAG